MKDLLLPLLSLLLGGGFIYYLFSDTKRRLEKSIFEQRARELDVELEKLDANIKKQGEKSEAMYTDFKSALKSYVDKHKGPRK